MMPFHRILSLVCLLFCLSATGLLAQSNDRIDELLLQPTARLDSTVYIVLSAGGQIAETDSSDVALEKAKSLGLIDGTLSPDSPVKLQELSYIIMKSLSLKGGVLYSLFPSPRYAYRELAYRKVIDDSKGPLRTVSGEEVVRVLGYASDLRGGAQ